MCVGRTTTPSTRGYRIRAVPERFRGHALLSPVNDNRVRATVSLPHPPDAGLAAAWRLVLATGTVGLVAAALCLFGLMEGERPR